MGIDIRTIQAQMSLYKDDVTSNSDNNQLQQYFPRGTAVDEFGNPILQDDMVMQEEEDEDDGLPKPFGYDVFSNAPMSFVAPSNDLSVPESYIIGPKDALSIQIFGKESYDYEVYVTSEGKVVIPELGPFQCCRINIY